MKTYLLLAAFYILELQKCVHAKRCNILLVEYKAVEDTKLEPIDRLNKNGENYVQIVSSFVDKRPDIIVFPEGTLDEGRGHNHIDYSFKIYPGDNPCEQPDQRFPIFLRNLSCLAVDHNLTIIINMIHHIHDDYENRDFEIIPAGAVDSRLAKNNRVGEDDLNERSGYSQIFKGRQDLDKKPFGIVGLEHLFIYTGNTSDQWVSGIKHYVISSKWRSELPFLTSLQVQQMWAHEEDLYLFVAGASNPKEGIGGSGIYLGKKNPAFTNIATKKNVTEYFYSFDLEGKQPASFSAQILSNTDEIAMEMDGFKLYTDDNFKHYTTKVIDVSKRFTEDVVCHTEHKPGFQVCCRFKLVMSANRTNIKSDHHKYTYHMVAFSGFRLYFESYTKKADICGVVACLSNDKMSCGLRFPDYAKVQWPVTFTSIVIEGEFIDDKNRRQYPSSLLSSIRPILPEDTIWTKKVIKGEGAAKNLVRRKFVLKKPQNRLMTFAIYGRDYSDINHYQPPEVQTMEPFVPANEKPSSTKASKTERLGESNEKDEKGSSGCCSNFTNLFYIIVFVLILFQ